MKMEKILNENCIIENASFANALGDTSHHATKSTQVTYFAMTCLQSHLKEVGKCKMARDWPLIQVPNCRTIGMMLKDSTAFTLERP